MSDNNNVVTCGCKHGKVDQKSALLYLNHNFFGQRPKSSYLNWIFFMMTSIVVLNTQM